MLEPSKVSLCTVVIYWLVNISNKMICFSYNDGYWACYAVSDKEPWGTIQSVFCGKTILSEMYLWLDLQKPTRMLQERKSKLCPNINDSRTHALSRGINCVTIDGQVCFHGRLFANPVKLCWCITVLLGHWEALIRIGCCVPDCCQWPSRSILWLVYIPLSAGNTALLSVA